jgi:ATP-dependent DNA helicase RecQ
MTDLEGLLDRHFGFDRFLPGQREVISSLLDGRSAAAVFPTGGGKSLCYQLPALELAGTTLVVSPLIALMKDQIDALAARGQRALRLDSSLDADQYRAAMAEVRSGAVKLVYVAPERFNNERFRESLSGLRISLFAVDEAHCISEWGHNFRPDYLKLVRYARECGAERVLALTATATERVLEDICASFGVAREHAVRTSFYRPNLTLLATPVTASERFDLLRSRLEERPPGATIVYVTLQRTADEVADRLAGLGLPARAYHAGKKTEERTGVQEWFFSAERPIVVATIAFGMGIDKPDIRYVYHYNLPKSLESYSQEIGRAGRDGQPSMCETLACSDDLGALESFVYGDTPSEGSIREILDFVFAEEGGGSNGWIDVSLHELAQRSDARQLVVQTLLTYLELDGYLEAGTPYYSQFEMQPRLGSAEILGYFEGERRAFLETLFRHCEKRRKWVTIDVAAACRAHGAPRERAVRALEYLSAQGWIELRVLGVRHRYRVLRRALSPDDLVATMNERFARRERAELDRLQQVLALIEADECQASRLGAHFSEPLEAPCGHCGWCLAGGRAVSLPPRRVPTIPEGLWREALALREEQPDALGEPRALARFLCGISSPRSSRARLGSHRLAGALAEVPFERVLERAAGEPSTGT